MIGLLLLSMIVFSVTFITVRFFNSKYMLCPIVGLGSVIMYFTIGFIIDGYFDPFSIFALIGSFLYATLLSMVFIKLIHLGKQDK